jgi:ATP-dependent RNA helicase DDX24/MAK5
MHNAPLRRKKPTAAKQAAAGPADTAPEPQEQQQQQQQKPKKGSNPWASTQGWKSVDVNDELILGADEYGFAGLEVLDDVSLIDPGVCVGGACTT